MGEMARGTLLLVYVASSVPISSIYCNIKLRIETDAVGICQDELVHTPGTVLSWSKKHVGHRSLVAISLIFLRQQSFIVDIQCRLCL